MTDADYEKRRRDAYRAAEAVRNTFRHQCEKAGIDRRNVPQALAELGEREAMTAADRTILLARYKEAMREYQAAQTRHEQICWHGYMQVLWVKLAGVRNVKLLGV